MQNIQESLYRQAQLYFSAEPLVELTPGISCYLYTSTLKENISLTRFYVLFNIYFLEKPKAILAYIQRHLTSQEFNLPQFLQALRSLSLVFASNIDKYQNLKQIYRLLSELEDAKKCISKDCSIPNDIANKIQGLGLRKKSLIDLQNKNQPILPVKPDERHSHDINLNYSKVVLLFANLKECLSQSDFDKIWTNIATMAEKYNLCYLKMLNIFIKSLQINRNIESCIYIFKKFHQALKGDHILRQIMALLQNKYFQQGQKVKYRKKIVQLQFQKGKNLSIPSQQAFRALSILIKAELIQYLQIFRLLTPSLKFLNKIEEQRIKAHHQYAKLCFKKSLQAQQKPDPIIIVWGEFFYSSKLQLLNHILLTNNFKAFKQIVQKYSIKIDVLYHPNILETLCSLFQWVIDPLYQKTEIPGHFKIKKNIQKAFPKGFFRQIHQISNELIDYLSELLQMAKSYLFSCKTTFIKTCRLFKEICTKNSKLPFQQSDINKKIITFISNVIKRHILSAVEYYSKDPSITFQIDRLIDCFKFKIQFEIYNDYLKQGQFSNLHLSFIYEHTTSELTKCLNRLTDSDVVIKKINKLLINNVFPSLYQIFQRLAFIPKDQLKKIIDAMNKTSKFTKKVALFFVFLQMGEHDKEMITSESEVNKKYELLISFTHSLLLFEKKNEEFIKIIFEYFIYKLSTFNSDVKQLSHFDLFHGQIYFMEGLLQNLLPIQLDECTINQYDRKYLVGGPLLKIKIMNKIRQFNETRVIRSSIIKSLFKPHLKCIFDNIFYFIILKLNTIQLFIVRNLSFNIATTAFLYDKFLKLMLSIINIAHFQTNSTQIDKYFKTKLFQPLVLYYKLPYQISFYIIRKSITEKMAKSKYDWNQSTKWLELKNYFIPHFQKYFKESKSQVKGFDCDNYSEEQINFFLDFDVFLLFWIQDIQYSLFLSLYTPHINELQKNISQGGDRGYEYLDMQCFCHQLKQERDTFAQIHYDLVYQKVQNSNSKRFREEYENKYVIFIHQEYDLQEKYIKFCKMFIKYCILPRAMLNKSEGYYSWCFYLHFLKKNKLPIQITVKLICLLLEAISRFVPFSTERQSNELLPLLYNTSMNIFSFWYNVSKFNDKLQKFLLVDQKLSHETYCDILYILYQSQTKIISYLLENKKEVFSIKNCMNFMYKCQNLPFCSDHGQIIINRFAEIKNQYKQCKDVIAMIQSYSKQFQNKLGLTRSIQNRIRSQYKSNSKVNASNLLNQTIPDLSFNDDNFDPLYDYPNLSTEIDFDNNEAQQNERYSYQSKRSNHCSRQVIFEKQFIPQFSEGSSKKKSKTTSSCPKKKDTSKPKQARNRK